MKKRFFSKSIISFLHNSIIPNSRILFMGEGSGEGEILDALRSSFGLEICGPETDLESLRRKFPRIEFMAGRLGDVKARTFDYIIMNDYLHYESCLHALFTIVSEFMSRETKIVIVCINPMMLFILRLAEMIGLPVPKIHRNIIRLGDLDNIALAFGYEVLDKGFRFFCPFRLLGIGDWLNIVIPRIPGLRRLCFGQYLVLRLMPARGEKQELSCSVVIPCFNEEENIAECVKRIPRFSRDLEIIVVNDGSVDRTEEVVRDVMKRRENIHLISYPENRGKGYAVNEGWKIASGDVLMMLDSDMTTPPEELPLFHYLMESGAEFVCGTRIIYPREKHALKFLNRVGITFFSLLMSWITQRRISDTFCGTKAFLKKHRDLYEIEEYKWGDWDLFFTAARYRMKMLEAPVHYRARKAGEAKMRPFRHGLRLLRYSLRGLRLVH